jgi:hypothetical protein
MNPETEGLMPLRDHFHTNSTIRKWEALHGFWPAAIVARLNSILPKEYIAQPRVRLGTMMEIDVGALERESGDLPPGGEPDEYEVNIYSQDEFRLVAAIELISPSNKDRPENRRTLVNKCEPLLKREVCVTIVDPVTSRAANIYGELLDELGAPRTAVSRSVIYAATCRGRRNGLRWRLESWEHNLAIDSALPSLPIWLSPDLMVPLELEATYEETCRSLRIP